MLNDYIQVAVLQLIERATILKGKLPGCTRPAFTVLEMQCCTKIDEAVRDLKAIRDNPAWLKPEKASVRLREFRRIAANIDRLENEAVAAIVRSGKDEGTMVRLLHRMGGEIGYPIVLPTISMLSQDYFFIRADFMLMCIPLMEPHFLLHLPDIYHELSHPLFRTQNDPRTVAWQNACLLAQGLIYDCLRNQLAVAAGSRTPDVIKRFLHFAMENWVWRWMEEIFCDLFGLFSVGPAYAWAHLHLHAERGGNAFQLPQARSSHPADDPRMTAMLDGLALLGEHTVAAQIEQRWKDLLKVACQTEPPDFQRYYPDNILRQSVQVAFDGFKAMGCKPWPADNGDVVRKLLNEAWCQFWHYPQDFVAWERKSSNWLLTLVPAEGLNSNVT